MLYTKNRHPDTEEEKIYPLLVRHNTNENKIIYTIAHSLYVSLFFKNMIMKKKKTIPQRRLTYLSALLVTISLLGTTILFSSCSSALLKQVIAANANKTTTDDNQLVFNVVDEPPLFPGGEGAMYEFLGKNMTYPSDAQKKKIQGMVVCQFVVERDGTIENVKIVRSVAPSLDKEAMRVVKSMPKWIPGTKHGRTVRVKYTIPITFRLN